MGIKRVPTSVGNRAKERVRSYLFRRECGSLGYVIDDVRREHLTYVSTEALIDLARAVKAIEERGLSGDIVEAGTALGGSAIVLGAAKSTGRRLWLYDTFGMIPPPSEGDGDDVHSRYAQIVSGASRGLGGHTYYGYRNGLLREVKENFARHGLSPSDNNVGFVQGRYEDVMDIDYPVVLAHVDCDWYSSVWVCLNQLDPHLVPGGRIVIDDYWVWSGCAEAVNQFVASNGGYECEEKSRLHLVKK